MGGGIGIPPMVETAKALDGDKHIIAGYRDELFLQEELKRYGRVYTATEDGSAGTPGNVLDAMMANGLTKEEGRGDRRLSLPVDRHQCSGPSKPMHRRWRLSAGYSMEERMACGVGACLACVCQSKEIDEHSKVHNKRVCKDGPVFLSTEVEL